MARVVMHMDLDAFYASVEQLRRPELRGKPVIVGGGDAGGGRAQMSRGVVSAASYEARVHGVHSAMPLATALRLCPHAIVVPVDFAAYRAASSAILVIAREYTPLPGLGPATETALSGLGIRTLGELAALPLELVQRRVGNVQGRSIWERARGVDESPVTVPGRPRSVSREETFARDLDDRATLEQR